jgi:hypothetical protein
MYYIQEIQEHLNYIPDEKVFQEQYMENLFVHIYKTGDNEDCGNY